MSRFKRIKTFKREVVVDYPVQDGKPGETTKVKFVNEYHYLDRKEISGLPKALSRDEEVHLLDRVLAGTHELEDEDGNQLSPTQAADIVKSDPWMCAASVKDWTNGVTGEKGKN